MAVARPVVIERPATAATETSATSGTPIPWWVKIVSPVTNIPGVGTGSGAEHALSPASNILDPSGAAGNAAAGGLEKAGQDVANLTGVGEVAEIWHVLSSKALWIRLAEGLLAVILIDVGLKAVTGMSPLSTAGGAAKKTAGAVRTAVAPETRAASAVRKHTQAAQQHSAKAGTHRAAARTAQSSAPAGTRSIAAHRHSQAAAGHSEAAAHHRLQATMRKSGRK